MAAIRKAQIFFFAFVTMISVSSCKTHLDSARYYDDNDPKKAYHLRLNPAVGSQYTYTVSRSVEFEMETGGKKITNENRSNLELTYSIGKDSAGDFLLNIVFNKIHLYTKNGDTEQELDADKAAESTDPVEKMLGILKGAQLRAIVDAAGQVKSIQGDEEIKNKMLAGLNPGDTYAKSVA